MKNFAAYKNIWVYAEQRDGKLMNVAFELLGEGHRLSRQMDHETKVCALLAGHKTDHLVEELYAYGADVVYQIENPLLKDYTTDGYTKVVSEAIEKYKPEIILFGATHVGRDLAPRIASRIDTGLTADCTRLDVDTGIYVDYLKANTESSLEDLEVDYSDRCLKQTKPAFGGNLMATIVTPEKRPQMATVRPGVMEKQLPMKAPKGQLVRVADNLTEDDIQVEVVEVVKRAKDIVNLSEAQIICAGGRGLGSAAGVKLLEDFSDKVGGVVGASRAAIDAGWIEEPRQIGQTGMTVKPRIYFACGISGAIQHVVGMESSDLIIAINKDPEALMMQIADYAICGDLNKVIPEIIAQWDKH